MCGVSMKDRWISKELRELVGVELITTVIENGRLRSYEHVMRKNDDNNNNNIYLKSNIQCTYRYEFSGLYNNNIQLQ